jgi:hypothetical protein
MELREAQPGGLRPQAPLQQQLPDERLRGFKQNALTCINNAPFVELTCGTLSHDRENASGVHGGATSISQRII